MKKGLARWMERERRPFCRLEKLTEMGGLRKKRIDGKKGKEFKGRRGWYAISIAPENIHLLLPRSGCVVFLSSFFFFCSFRWLFMQRASIKTLERILLASLCNRVFFDTKFFVIIRYEKKTIDYYSSILKCENMEYEFLGRILRKLI